MEYYSSMRKKEMVSFAITWVDLGYTMLSEITQRKANTGLYHLYLESKKDKLKWTHTSHVKPALQKD